MLTISDPSSAVITFAPTSSNTLAADIEAYMSLAEEHGASLVIDLSAFAGQIVNILQQLSFRCPVRLVNKGAEPVVFTGGDWLINAAVTVENVVPPTAYVAPGATLTGEGVNAETTHKVIVVRTQSDITSSYYETSDVAALTPTDKLIFDGFTGYWPANNQSDGRYLFDYAVEIAGGGVSINNGFSGRTYHFLSSLSGSGNINFNWVQVRGASQWFFNGDVSGYTGTIAVSSAAGSSMYLTFNGDSEMNLNFDVAKTSSRLYINGTRTVNSCINMLGSTVYVNEGADVEMTGTVTAGTLSVSGALSMSNTAAVTTTNVTVAANASLTVQEGAEMSVSGTLTNNGTLRVNGMLSAASLNGNGSLEFGENSVLKYSLSSAYGAESALRSMLAAAEGLGAKNVLIDVTALAGQTLQLSEPLALPMGVELRNTAEQAIRIEGEVNAPHGVALMGDWNAENLTVSEGAVKLMVRLTNAESFESDIRAALQQAQQDGVSALVFEVTALAGQTLSLSEALELAMDVEFCNTAEEMVRLTGAALSTTATLTLSKGVVQDCLQGNYVGREQVSYVTESVSIYTPADLADLSVAEGDTVLWMTDNQLATSVSIPELENVHHVSISRNEMSINDPESGEHLRMEGLQNGPLTIHGAADVDAVVEIEDNAVRGTTAGASVEVVNAISQWGMDIRHLGSLSIARNTARAESEYRAGVDSGVACGELTFADIRTVAIVGNSAVAVTPRSWFVCAGAFAGQISFSDIDSLLVADNHAEGGDRDLAGAIWGGVDIRNVNSAIFRGNYIKGDDGVTLRSICDISSERPITFTLSSGQRVAFYDTVYAEGTLTLDAARGATLLFSGAEVRDTLAALGVEQTAENVLRSSTSFAAEMLVNGGTLAVEDGAVLSGEQMTLAAGAELRISADAAVSLSGSLVSDGAIIIDFSKAGDGLYENILSYGSFSGTGTEVRAEGLTEGAVCVFYQEANGISAYLNSKILVVSSAEAEGPGSLAEALATAAGMDATDEFPVYIYLDALAGKTLDTAAYAPVEAPVALVNRSGESVTLTQALTLTRPSTLRNVTVAGDVSAEASLTLDGSTVQGKVEVGTGEVLTILSEHGTTVVEGDIVNKGVLVLDGMLQINGEILSEEGSVLHGDNYGRVVALTDAATAEADMKRILADSHIKQVIFDVTALAGQTVQLHDATVWKTPAQIINHGTEAVSFEGGYWEMYAPVQLEGVSAPAVALLGNGALSGGNAAELLNHKRLDVVSQVSLGSGIMLQEVADLQGADELVLNGFIGHLPAESLGSQGFTSTYVADYDCTIVIGDKGASISHPGAYNRYEFSGAFRGTGTIVMAPSGSTYDTATWNISADMSCFYGSLQIFDTIMNRTLNLTGDSDIHAAEITFSSSRHTLSISGHRSVSTNLEMPESTLTLAADSDITLTGHVKTAQMDVQGGTTVCVGGEQSVGTLTVASGSTYTLAEGGCLSMENGSVSGSGAMVVENGGELHLQGGTLALTSLQAAARAKVSLEGCALSNTRLTLSAEAELHLSGLDLSRTSITVTDAGEGKMIDLSGNSWGTDSYADIFAKLGDAAPYVTIDGVSYADLEEYDEVFPVTKVSSSVSMRGSLAYALAHAATVPFEKVVLVKVAPDLAGQAVVLTGDIALPHCSVEWVGNGLHVQSAAGSPERVVRVSNGSEVACNNLVFEGVRLSVESEGMLVMSDVTQTQSGCVVAAGAILWANDSTLESLEIGGSVQLSNVEVADMCLTGEGKLSHLTPAGPGYIRVTDTLVFSDFAGTTGDVLSQVTWAEESPEIRLTGSLSGATISALPEGMAYTCASLEVAVGSSVAVESGAHLLSSEAEPLHVRGTLTAAAGADLGEHVLVHEGGTLAMEGGAYCGTLTVEAGATLQLRGADLSGMTLVISGQPTDLIDLSGNSWGTDNYEAIFAALGDAAPYVTIDGYTSLDFLGEGIYGVRLAAGDAETPGTLAWALEHAAAAPAELTPEIVFSSSLSGQEVLLKGWMTTERDLVIRGAAGVTLAADGGSGLDIAAGHVTFEQLNCTVPVFVDADAELTVNGGRYSFLGSEEAGSTISIHHATVDMLQTEGRDTITLIDSCVEMLNVLDEAPVISGQGNTIGSISLWYFVGSTENLAQSGLLSATATKPTYIYLDGLAGDATLATLPRESGFVYAVRPNGNVYVAPEADPENVSLTLQDGVQLVLQEGAELEVCGRVLTEGAYTTMTDAIYADAVGAQVRVTATGELTLQNANLNLTGAGNKLDVEGSLSMDGGRLSATEGVNLHDGSAVTLTGVTVQSVLNAEGSLSMTNCTLEDGLTVNAGADFSLTNSSITGEMQLSMAAAYGAISGNDFSKTTIVLTDLSAESKIDLSGNFWGENADRETVWERLGDEVASHVIINDLPAADFTVTSVQPAGLLSAASDTLRVSFSHAVKADSLTADNTYLRAEDGSEIHFTSMSLDGKELLLGFAPLPADGVYTLVIGGEVQSKYGTPLAGGAEGEEGYRLNLTADVTHETVLAVLPEKAFKPAYVDVVFSGAIHFATVSSRGLSLRTADGVAATLGGMSMVGPDTLRIAISSLPTFGDYTLILPEGIADAAGNAVLLPETPATVTVEAADVTASIGESMEETVRPNGALQPAITLTNSGNAAAEGLKAELWLTTSGSITSASVLLAVTPAELSLAAGAQTSWSPEVQLGSLPSTVRDGNYTLVVRVSATNELPVHTGDNKQSIGTLTVKTPELSLTVSDTQAREGGEALTYTVTRTGDCAEELTVQLNSAQAQRLGLPETVSFAAGESSVSFTAAVVNDAVFTGDAAAQVTVSAAGYKTSPSANLTIIEDETPALSLTLSQQEVTEGSGVRVLYTVTRQGDTSRALTVKLDCDEAARLGLPETVTIAAGQRSASFRALPVNDKDYQGDVTAHLSVSAEGYLDAQATLLLRDDEKPTFTLVLDKDTAGEGEKVHAVVSMNTVATTDTVVKLGSTYAAQISMPATVTIKAGETSAAFDIAVTDDSTAEIDKKLNITAAATGFNSGSAALTVTDNDLPLIQLVLNKTLVSETAGVYAISASLVRTGGSSEAITIRLKDAEGIGLILPTGGIRMGQGVNQVNFNIGVVDDTLANGERTGTIIGTVIIDDCGCDASSSYGGVIQSAPITVLDNDSPALAVSMDKSTIREGGADAAVLTIVSNYISEEDVEIHLSGSLALDMPETLVLRAGSDRVSCSVSMPSDGETTGTLLSVLKAEADGFIPGVGYLQVTDSDLPDLVADAPEILGAAIAGQEVTVALNLRNVGYIATDKPVTVQLRLNDGTELGTVTVDRSLAAGESIRVEKKVTLPSTTGSFSIHAVVDSGLAVTELDETNNNAYSPTFRVGSGYTISAQVEEEVLYNADVIHINGSLSADADGLSLAGQKVTLYLYRNNSPLTSLTAIAGEDGKFSVDYRLPAGIAGQFAMRAGMYAEMGEVQDTFSVAGLSITSGSAIQWLVTEGEETYVTVRVRNTGGVDLTDVVLCADGLPDNITLVPEFEGGVALAAGKETSFRYKLTGTAPNIGSYYSAITFTAESAQGAQATATGYTYVKQPAAVLKLDVDSSLHTFSNNATAFIEMTVSNTGGADTGRLTVNLPHFDGLSLYSGGNIENLAPGESAKIVLSMDPRQAELILNAAYDIRLAVTAEHATAAKYADVSFKFTDEHKCNLTINALHSSSLLNNTVVGIAGAKVTLFNATNSTVAATGTADANGVVHFENLEAGKYYYYVDATDCQRYKANISLNPGEDRTEDVYMSTASVTYTFTVERTEIEDKYEIVQTVDYVTNVPGVVLVFNPTQVEIPEMDYGDVCYFSFSASNYGLVAAQQVQLTMPNIRGLSMTVMNPVDNIAAQSSYTFWVEVKADPHSAWENLDPQSSVRPWDCASGSIYARYQDDILANWLKVTNGPNVKTTQGTCTGSSGYSSGSWGGGYSNVYIPTIIPTYSGGGSGGGGSSWVSAPTVYQTDVRKCSTCVEALINTVDALRSDAGIRSIESSLAEAGTDELNSLFRKYAAVAGEPTAEGFDVLANTMGKVLMDLERTQAIMTVLSSCWKVEEITDSPITQMIKSFFTATDQIISSGSKLSNTFAALLGPAGSAFSLLRDNLHDAMNGNAANRVGEVNKAVSGFMAFAAAVDEATGRAHDGEAVQPARLTKITEAAISKLLKLEYGQALGEASVRSMAEKWNRTLDYLALGITSVDDVPAGSSRDFFSAEEYKSAMEALSSCREEVENAGYEHAGDYISDMFSELEKNILAGGEGVCARVKLSFTQTAVMSREAFDGTLTLTNASASGDLSDVRLQVTVKDSAGIDVSEHFRITFYSVEGIDAEGGTLESGKTAVYHIQYLPDKTIAANGASDYYFGGSINYVDPLTNSRTTLSLSPVTLEVNPSPNLKLHYFLTEDVYSDDPYTTEVVEKAQTAEIGLLVLNEGKGAAKNFTMTDFTPSFISNESGLALELTMLGSRLNGGELQQSGAGLNFGDVEGGSTASAVWYFNTNVQGYFTNYQSSFTRVDSMGNESVVTVSKGDDKLLSLIEDTYTHMLVRSMDADGDGKTDFLVNDKEDIAKLADGLYLSDGSYEDVNAVTAAKTISGSLGGTQRNLFITVHVNEGWNYIRLSDPGNGLYSLLNVAADGHELADGTFWQTDRRISSSGTTLDEKQLHMLFEAEQSGDIVFEVRYDPVDHRAPEVLSITGVASQEVLHDAPERVTVTFSEQVDTESFTSDCIVLRAQGVRVDISGLEWEWNDSHTALTITNLRDIVRDNVLYGLTVTNAGVRDMFGNAGEGSGRSVQWTQASTFLVVESITGTEERRLNQRVDQLLVGLSSAPDNFTTDDITVTLTHWDGTTEEVTNLSSLSISRVTDTIYAVSGLHRIQNSGDGTYSFSVNAKHLSEHGMGINTAAWELHETPPSVLSHTLDAKEVMLNNVDSLLVRFSHAIGEVDLSGVTVTRNGTVYSTLGLVIKVDENDSSLVRFSGFSHLEAAHAAKSGTEETDEWAVTMDLSHVTDAYGNAGSGTYDATWTVDNIAPRDLENITLNGKSTSVIAGNSVVLGATLPEGGLTVSVYDRASTASGYGLLLWTGTVEGTDFSRELQMATGGSRVLSVVMEDAAGNTTVNTIPVLVDVVALSAEIAMEPQYAAMPDSITIAFSAEVNDLPLSALMLRDANGKSLSTEGLQVAQLSATEWQVSGWNSLITIIGDYSFGIDFSALTKTFSGLQGQGSCAVDFRYDSVTSVEITHSEISVAMEALTAFSLTFSTDINYAALEEAGLLPQAVSLVNTATGESYLPEAAGFSYAEGVLSWVGSMELPGGDYRVQVDGTLLTAANGAPLVGNTNTAGVVAWGSAPTLLGVSGNSYAAPYAVDWNGDGYTDLLVGEKTADNRGKVRLYLNDGSGNFSTYTYVQSNGADLAVSASGCQGIVVALQDLNGDGIADMVAGLSDGSVQFFLGNADGSFGAATVLADAAGTPIAMGSRAYPTFTDWNGDGVADLILGSGDGKLFVALGSETVGGLSFAAAAEIEGITVSGRAAPLFTDVNGDGMADLVLGDADGRLTLFRNTGSSYAKVAEWALDDVDWTRSRLTVADLNGDGLQDLIVGGSTGAVYTLYGTTAPVWSQEVHISTAPVVADLVATVNGREVTLAWVPTGEMDGCTLRVELATTPDFADAQVISGLSGSSHTLSDVAEGVYYWRVRPEAADGTAYAWTTGASYTVDVTAPTLPQSLTAEVHGTTASLRWLASEDVSPVSYEIRYAKTADMESAQTMTTRQTLLNVADLTEGVWFWQVRATDGTHTSDWSDPATVEVIPGSAPAESLHILAHGLTTTAEGELSGAWTDINKAADGSDSRLCWAISAANMLAWWQREYADALALTTTTAPMAAEDIYATFRTNWTNVSGQESYGLSWWIAGSSTDSAYTDFYTHNHIAEAAGGAYYSTYYGADTISSLVSSVSMTGMETAAIAGAWQSLYEDGGILSLGIYRNASVSGKLSGGHAVTLWGFALNADDSCLQSITISDSDDAATTPVTLHLVYNTAMGHYQIMAPESKLHGYYLGDYTTLGAYVDVAADNSTDEATELSFTVSADGAHTEADLVRNWVGSSDAQDYYKFTAESAGSYKVSLNPDTLTGPGVLSVFKLDANGEKQQFRTTSFAAGSLFASLSRITMAKGETCYICIESANGQNAAYELSVQGDVTSIAQVTANNSAALATKLSAYESASALEGWVGVGDDTDCYRVLIAGDGLLNIDLSGLSTTAKIKVMMQGEDGELVQVLSKNVKANTGYHNSLSVADGAVYFVSVSSYNGKSAQYNTGYQLNLQKETPQADGSIETMVYGPADPRLTEDNTPESAALLAAATDSTAISGWIGRGDACDYYRLDMVGSGSLSIKLDDLETSAKVRIYTEDENGKLTQLASKTVKASTGFDRTLSVLDGSVYYVQVLSYDDGAGNYNSAYSLTLESETEQQDGTKKTTHYGLASL